MISTHWRELHQPTERALLRLDVLARQAADLIERSKTEIALREGNEQLLRLASIVESSNDSIITKNLDGIITSWNKSAEQLFGYTAEEAVGKSITILIPADRHTKNPRFFLVSGAGGASIIMKPFACARMAAWSIFR
jgi:PAS domain-containing protein